MEVIKKILLVPVIAVLVSLYLLRHFRGRCVQCGQPALPRRLVTRGGVVQKWPGLWCRNCDPRWRIVPTNGVLT